MELMDVISEKDISNIEEKVFSQETHIKFSVDSYYANKTVMICGAAGSIGQNIIYKLCSNNVKRIIAVDQDDVKLYDVYVRYRGNKANDIVPILYNLCDCDQVYDIVSKYLPDVIIDCAGYKVVPILQDNVKACIENNILTVRNIFEVAAKLKIKKVILLSTYEAYFPKNVVGMTKKMVEIMIQSYACKYPDTTFAAIRFGLVLFSRGGAGEFFMKQVLSGATITVTDPEVSKYMCSLDDTTLGILAVGAMEKSGVVYSIKSDTQIKILDIVKIMKDYFNKQNEITVIGLRPGDKLCEKPYDGEYGLESTDIEKIFISKVRPISYEAVNTINTEINELLVSGQQKVILSKLIEKYS